MDDIGPMPELMTLKQGEFNYYCRLCHWFSNLGYGASQHEQHKAHHIAFLKSSPYYLESEMREKI